MMRQIAIIILEALLISTSALAIDFGPSPPPEPTAAPATDTPGDENIDESSTALVDPTSDDDADGKTYDEETILGTDPEVFNLFSETHYPALLRSHMGMSIPIRGRSTPKRSMARPRMGGVAGCGEGAV